MFDYSLSRISRSGCLAAGLFLFASPLFADEKAADLEAVPEPPEIPPTVQSGEPVEPEVTIIKKDDATIEEYRVNGQLYMVKITPVIGKPYYLIDHDGDGSFDRRTSQIGPNVIVPEWVIFEW